LLLTISKKLPFHTLQQSALVAVELVVGAVLQKLFAQYSPEILKNAAVAIADNCHIVVEDTAVVVGYDLPAQPAQYSPETLQNAVVEALDFSA